jgi:hypothetical protein
MPHLWVQDEENEWAVLPLDGDCLELSSIPTPMFRCLDSTFSVPPALLRTRDDASEQWTLVAGAEHRVTVNGTPLGTGIRVLRNRDQVDISGVGSVFYSSERQARIEPLPTGLGEVFCPRCRQRIEEGTPAVRCPGPQCGLWYHQSHEYPCWLYAPTCAVCPQRSALDAGFQFCPEDL